MRVFALPLSNASSPTASLPAVANGRATSLAFDSAGNLYAASFSDFKIYVFAPPITSSSTPAFSFAVADRPEGVVFDGTGRLFVSGETTGTIYVFNPPFSPSSTAAFSMTGAGNPRQAVFDQSGNLIVSACSSGTGDLRVFNAPFSNAETPSVSVNISGASCVSGVAIDPVTHKLFAGDLDITRIVVFNLPLSNSSTPTLTISGSSTIGLWSLAFDASENLYGADWNQDQLDMYAPPFSTSMNPTVAIGLSFTPSGLVLGP